MYKVTFNNKNSLFYDTIKANVEEYFSKNKISSTGNFKLYLKALVLIPSAIAIYSTVIFFHIHPALSIMLCGIFGFVLACIGFNIMHDACHGSYSKKKWINYMMGLSLNCLGGNSFIWKIKHNIIHHTYTNVDGVDDDIAKMPLIRQCESQKHLRIHKYQHIYTFMIYALSSFLWVFLMDFIKYFGKKITNTPINKISTAEHIIFWVSKVLYVIFYIAVPIYFVGALPWLLGFTAMHLVKGFTLAIVFQLAHVVEDTQFIEASLQPKKVEQEWAIYQMNTTANFATKNKIISWLTGGLNFQVEHHLFPRVSHVHYPAISKLLIECCEQFGVKYICYPTLTSAIASHYRFMKHLGR
ncbi:MAG: acyl-CoA desaturase [Bacteroidia bacterium]